MNSDFIDLTLEEEDEPPRENYCEPMSNRRQDVDALLEKEPKQIRLDIECDK